MQKYECLVCNKDMTIRHRIKFVDYYCNLSDDHHFAWRIKDNTLIKLRIRFSSKKEMLCLKIHYDSGYSEVWSQIGADRIHINQIVYPNFVDVEKLKNKIRNIIMFS